VSAATLVAARSTTGATVTDGTCASRHT